MLVIPLQPGGGGVMNVISPGNGSPALLCNTRSHNYRENKIAKTNNITFNKNVSFQRLESAGSWQVVEIEAT